ncbi:MAG: protein kinase [Gemmatimonadota bacterium]|nr:protein kinase [Gemmatimonadota bacterium]MDH3477770.1 protein kinase [Gemmatimonadota bacterium]MDH3569073.1 protein kinase [Gemmatimonadota bacterium]MDH5548506.1 protein kinase [Gemmatimonadota bacterium]
MDRLSEQLDHALGSAYAVERELGGGGMSRVFVAHDTTLDRRVVVKVLAEHLRGDVSVERFNREIMVAAGLQHPHIVGVLSAGVVDELPYFIMPWVEGESLRQRLATGPLPVPETISVLQDVARALAYAHDRGIVHRDVKPDNILLSHGAAALTDFGVAKALRSARETDATAAAETLTQEGTSLGTPAYMAPEQAAGDTEIDRRVDIYSLGITAYEMLVGQPPFHGRPFSALIAAHLVEAPPPLKRPDAPAGLRNLVMACLAKDPGQRPQSAGAIVTALDDPDIRSGTWGAAARRRRHVGAIAGVLLAATVALTGYLTLRSRPAGPATVEKSIAVLPLVNVSGDTADTYFADGMTDELIGALQRVPNLRVASRTAVFAYRRETASPEQIGRDLRVSTLLEGTVRRSGNQLRLTAQLVNANDGFTMWSETYQAGMSDVFAVQDSIAQAIVAALRERFGDSDLAVASRKGTRDLEAYDQYLRGRYLFAKRGQQSLQQAIEYFQSAIARDSAFAGAHAGLAEAYGVLPYYAPVPPDSILPLGLEAADQAIALDSTLAAAFASRGSLLINAWRWSEAERDFRTAIRLDPEYASAHQWYGEELLILGQVDSAVAEMRRATELDPVSAVMAASYAIGLAVAGHAEDALRAGRRAVELAPDAYVAHWLVGSALLNLDRDSAAVVELEAVRAAGAPPHTHGLLGFAYARAGRRREALEILHMLQALPDRTGADIEIARVHLGLGQIDSAFVWLDRAVDNRDFKLNAESLWSPIWAPLHRDPRFAAILARLNIPDGRLGG